MLSILSTYKKQTNKNTKGHKKTMESVGYVYYLDCNDGIMAVCLRPNNKIKNITYVVFFVYQLYLTNAVFFKKGNIQNKMIYETLILFYFSCKLLLSEPE